MKTGSMATLRLAIAALAAAVGALPACGGPKDTTPVEVVAYRPDGSLVLFTEAGIYVYDGLLRTELRHIPLDALGVPPPNGGFYSYSLSADGTTAAVSIHDSIPDDVTNYPTKRVAIYRIPDGDIVNMFEVIDAAPLQLSPDGKLLCAIKRNDTGKMEMTMLDAATGATLWTAGIWGRLPPVWSPDGTTVFATDDPDVSGVDRTLNALDARTGTLKWQTTLSGTDLLGLAVVGDGALLATASYVLAAQGVELTDPPPTFPFRSAADGTLAIELPGVPQTWLYAGSPTGNTSFTCNATDTCAAGLRDYSRSEQPQPKYVRVFQPDGTVLQTLQTEGQGATPSIAISPDGNFLTTAAEPGVNGGATVFAIADGSVVAAHVFPTETF